MAHNPTRISGFEGGSPTFLDDMQGTPEVVGAAARSGDYGLRIIAPTGAGVESATLALALDPLFGGAPDFSNDLDVARVRLYCAFVSLPVATSAAELFTLKDSGGTTRQRVDINSAGRLLLNGVAGSTVLVTGTQYRLELQNDLFSNAILMINGTSELTSASVNVVNRIVLGKSGTAGGTGGYTAHFDDVVIETSDDLANIDWPGAGKVLRLDVDGDGFYDGTWTATTGASAYQSVGIPDNGDTNRILSPTDPTTGNQTCTLESTASAGVAAPIGAVQFTAIDKLVTANDSGLQLIARSGGTDQALTAPNLLTSTYAPYAYCSGVSPFTAVAWTTAELDALEVGLTMADIT